MLNTLCSFFFLVHHSMLPNTNSCLTCLHLWPFCTWTLTWGSGWMWAEVCCLGLTVIRAKSLFQCLWKREGEYPSLHSNQNLTTYDGHNVLLRFLIVVTFPCKGDMHLCIFLHILMTLHAVSWISWCDICQQATKGNCLSFSEILIPFQHFSPITHRKGLHLCFIGLKCSFHC